jgi:two-component sensor histidine kinase
MRIRTKIILVFLSVTLLSLVISSMFAYLRARRVLEREVLEHLYSVATIQKNRLEAVVTNLRQHLQSVASWPQLRLTLEQFLADPQPAYQEHIRRLLQDADAVIPAFQHLAVFTPDGRLVTATVPARLVTSNLDALRPLESGLAFHFSRAADGQLRLALALPFSREHGVHEALLGYLVAETHAGDLLRIVSDYAGLGDTGETILAQRDAAGNALFLTPLRFDPHAALRRTVSKQAHTVAVTHALQGQEQQWKHVVDYRGVPVLAATAYLPAYGWGLVVKMDRAEALAPVSHLHQVLSLLFGLMGLAVIAVGALLSHVITRPILRLTRAAEHIEQGELVQGLEITSADETGVLTRTVNRMAAELITAKETLEQRVQQIISSLLNLQAGIIADQHVKALLRESQSRVKSMALVHETLYHGCTFTALDFQKYVQGLGRYLYDSYSSSPNRITLQLDVAPLSLALDTAMPCGLILTELVSNAFKYAFPDGTTGTIRVEARQEPSGAYVISVADDGQGLPPDLDYTRSPSLGLQLVTNLARQLAAELAQEPVERGTRFVIRFWNQPHDDHPAGSYPDR